MGLVALVSPALAMDEPKVEHKCACEWNIIKNPKGTPKTVYWHAPTGRTCFTKPEEIKNLRLLEPLPQETIDEFKSHEDEGPHDRTVEDPLLGSLPYTVKFFRKGQRIAIKYKSFWFPGIILTALFPDSYSVKIDGVKTPQTTQSDGIRAVDAQKIKARVQEALPPSSERLETTTYYSGSQMLPRRGYYIDDHEDRVASPARRRSTHSRRNAEIEELFRRPTGSTVSTPDSNQEKAKSLADNGEEDFLRNRSSTIGSRRSTINGLRVVDRRLVSNRRCDSPVLLRLLEEIYRANGLM